MVENLHNRIEILEEEMDTVKKSLDGLTAAVNELTSVLLQGKGAVKFFMWIVMSAGALGTLLTWVSTHVKLNLGG